MEDAAAAGVAVLHEVPPVAFRFAVGVALQLHHRA